MAGYGEDQGLGAWIAARGLTLPIAAAAFPALRQLGSDYVDALYGPRFTGYPADVTQERAWPRVGATAWGQALATDAVPAAVVSASYAAAFAEAGQAGILSASVTGGGAVKREKVDGAVEVEYFQASGGAVNAVTTTFSIIDGLLQPYIFGGTVSRGVALMVV